MTFEFKSRKKEEDGGEGKDIMQQRAKAGLYKGANERRAVRTRRDAFRRDGTGQERIVQETRRERRDETR